MIYLLVGTNCAGQAEWPLVSFRTDQLGAVVADLRQRGVSSWSSRETGTPIGTLESFDDGPFRTDERGVATPDALTSRKRGAPTAR